MRVADGHAEPSMEDILSSIKRIIAEDSEATLSGPRVKRSVGLSPLSRPEPADEIDEEDEVLELTDPVAVEPTPEPEPRPEPVVLATKPNAAPAPKAKEAHPAVKKGGFKKANAPKSSEFVNDSDEAIRQKLVGNLANAFSVAKIDHE